jgi:glycosyltransferase involved in cell wall biosynthesis
LSNPVVTVAICMHNGSRYIVETLGSVFAQTVQDFEIVLVDDGSTDRSVEIVRERFNDDRLRIVPQRPSITTISGFRRSSNVRSRSPGRTRTRPSCSRIVI